MGQVKSPVVSAPRLPSTFSALRHRNFRLWFIGQTLSMVGTWMQSVAQGWLVFQLTGSEFALGAISFIGTFPTLFLMLPPERWPTAFPPPGAARHANGHDAAGLHPGGFAATKTLQTWHIGVLAACRASPFVRRACPAGARRRNGSRPRRPDERHRAERDHL
jgi:hypothetical protein